MCRPCRLEASHGFLQASLSFPVALPLSLYGLWRGKVCTLVLTIFNVQRPSKGMEYASHHQEAHMNPVELLSPITSTPFEFDTAVLRGTSFTRNNSSYSSSLHRPESELGCQNLPYSQSHQVQVCMLYDALRGCLCMEMFTHAYDSHAFSVVGCRVE